MASTETHKTDDLELLDVSQIIATFLTNDDQNGLAQHIQGIVEKLQETIKELQFEVHALERFLCGRRSEKVQQIAHSQLDLFDEILQQLICKNTTEDTSKNSSELVETKVSSQNIDQTEEQNASNTEGTSEKSPTSKKSQRGKRRNYPIDETIDLPIAASEQTCPKCHQTRHHMGYVDCRVTKYIPARFKHILYRRQKVACRTCEGQIAVAPLPQERVLDNSTPCPYLLAKIVTNKAVDIIPLNRTQKRFKSDGFDVSVQNLCRWEEGARQMLQPLVDRIAQKVKDADLIMLDDTNLKVRRKDAQNGIIKGRLWTFIGRYFDPGGDLKKTQEYTYYMYAPNWSTEHPEQYLYGSSAMLQGDGYKGYERIACEYMGDCVGKILSGCMMHGRRRFYEAYEYGDPLASFFIQRFQQIYRIEAVAKEKDLTVEQRRQLRQENSLLIFQEILSKAQDMQHLSLSRVMRDAIRYLLNQSSQTHRSLL